MKKGKTKETLRTHQENLKKIKSLLPLLVQVRKNNINKTKTLIIIDEKFDKVFEIVLEIKSSINTPLNQNHLIFTDKEEFDAHAFKSSMKERMINRG